ncbi:MAG: N-acetylmuramoyl-L-alanine amidase [Candidatus Omnitrophica bacterium]|nr:N-acetylmuramoyl-L-alanine amidase [Candidatus Omnitrophota bacterium]
MKKLFSLFLITVFLCGCVSVSSRMSPTREKVRFQEMKQFCKKNNLNYSFNTLDDILTLNSTDKDIRLVLNSLLVYFNGEIFNLRGSPFYEKGRIFIPEELGKLISKKIRKITPAISMKIIVIDPGHGGKDPGAISRGGLKEKDVNLKVSKLLKRELETRGFKVYLTRKTDIYLTLQRRVDIARERRADLFISVHANANHSRKVSGVEVYHLSSRHFNSEKRLSKLAKQVSRPAEGHYSKCTQKIVSDLVKGKNNAFSLNTASTLVNTFKKLGFKVKTPRGAPFYVLKYNHVPSVLVEIGYLSNRYEEKLLRSSRYQKEVARAIALGVVSLNNHYSRLAKRN